MNGLLVTGGRGPTRSILDGFLGEVEFIIAADSGFDLALRLDLDPDLVVGDMDSISDVTALSGLTEERLRVFPRDKDETDTEIGLRVFQELGYDSVTIAGGGGGRLDHLLGIVSLFERPFAPTTWLTDHEHVQLISTEFQLSVCENEIVSFFPVGEYVAGLVSEGLKWPLDGMIWRRGQAGISNLTVSDRLRVGVGQGRLLMVRTLA